MTNELNIQAITERVAREGEIPPVGTYEVEAANFLEVKLSKKGTKGIAVGFFIKSNAKDGTDASGYSLQRYTNWSLSGVLEGVSKKTGKPYKINQSENLVVDFARMGFEAADITAIVDAITNASPTTEDSVMLFGTDASPLLNANGDVVTLKGKTFKVSVAHEEYQGRTNARFTIGKLVTK